MVSETRYSPFRKTKQKSFEQQTGLNREKNERRMFKKMKRVHRKRFENPKTEKNPIFYEKNKYVNDPQEMCNIITEHFKNSLEKLDAWIDHQQSKK